VCYSLFALQDALIGYDIRDAVVTASPTQPFSGTALPDIFSGSQLSGWVEQGKRRCEVS
jgi:hypothetical protein